MILHSPCHFAMQYYYLVFSGVGGAGANLLRLPLEPRVLIIMEPSVLSGDLLV